MFRIQAYVTNAILVGIDLALAILCLLWAWHLNFPVQKFPTSSGHLAFLGILLLSWVVLAAHFNLYHSRRMDSPFADAGTLVKASLGCWLMVHALDHLLPASWALPTGYLTEAIAVFTAASVIARIELRLIAQDMRKRGHNVKNLVLIATPELGDRIAGKLDRETQLGYRIVRRISYSPNTDHGRNVMSELLETLASTSVQDVIVGLPAVANVLTAELARECENRGVNIRVVPDLFPLIRTDTQVYDLDGLPLVNVRFYPAEYVQYAIHKRIFDVVFSILILILISPLYLVVAILIKLTSPGPVHFVQERVGLNGKKFKMLKFRSMAGRIDSDSHWTVRDDPNVTPLGRFLRKSNFDELPQFLNVLKGDMSIVGPRPERPVFIERFRTQVPEYMARHYVKSGITGWAQVNGWRGDTSIPQRVACDLYYIRNWALALDVKIVLLTVVKTFFHRNAY
jgi:Undecaprenyl-phosphate glucose phosphotransferase